MKSLKSAARRNRTGPRTMNSEPASSTSKMRRDFDRVDKGGMHLAVYVTRRRLRRLAAFPRPARRDRVVELHQHNKRNAPIRTDDTEQGAERIQRLRHHNAAANRGW